jgi:hypothetical protein
VEAKQAAQSGSGPRSRGAPGLADAKRVDEGSKWDDEGKWTSDSDAKWGPGFGAAPAEAKHTWADLPEGKGDGDGDGFEDEALADLEGLAAAGLTEQDVEDVFSYARHGRTDDIEDLLDRGLPVDVRDVFGNTLLTIASQNGNKRVAKLVLRRGANINARNHKGNTPLHYCFQCKSMHFPAKVDYSILTQNLPPINPLSLRRLWRHTRPVYYQQGSRQQCEK